MEYCLEMILGGRKLRFETGELAKQANGSVLVRYGDTAVLVTVCASKEPREGVDFFPLLVEYEERLYAVGKIPGGWIKREGKPSEIATLSARMIDRPLRPLFPEGFRNDVQIVATVLSVDLDNAPDIPALLGASLALSISDVPFNGPVAGIRVGRINGEFIANPRVKETEASDLHLVVAGTRDAILMVEGGGNEVPEYVIVEAISFAHGIIKEIIDLEEKMVELAGKPKMEFVPFSVGEALLERVRPQALEPLRQAIMIKEKRERDEAIDRVKAEVLEQFRAELGEDQYLGLEGELNAALDKLTKEEVRRLILEEGIRTDGRGIKEIRPITCKVGLLPRVHGSGLFTRGQTQVLSAVTLGAVGDEQLLDGLTEEESKRYLHHYNFPPFSVGEVRPIRGAGRREIGHGALAERALFPMIPSEDEFPYTIRVVSEVLESNGSTSQASVCGSTLALMDAGVPIKKPVSGIAMGLVTGNGKAVILSDIQGIEDAAGDMDFKVAGTRDGITAVQMDIKIPGIDVELIRRVLDQAHEGRLYILDRMLEVIPEPRKQLSPYAPRMITMEIDPDKIRDVIGPGGKVIRKIIEETGVKIDIEDDGRVFIASPDEAGCLKAKDIIENLTRDVEVGRVYMGTVTRVTNFGAFVEVLPGKEGLVHISELARGRVARVEDVVKVGDQVLVKVIDIDRQGRVNLSRKEALPNEEPPRLDTKRRERPGKYQGPDRMAKARDLRRR